MKQLIWIAVLMIILTFVGFGLLLWLGGPAEPPTMQGITQAFGAVDYSDAPEPMQFASRNGDKLAYRHYPPAQSSPSVQGSVVLVHGSSATSKSMHPLANALAAAGYSVYSLDIRGHGASGAKGHIDYVGQLENDLSDFVKQMHPPQPSTLAGFSSGGGFVLRYAASTEAKAFQSFLLLSPFVHQSAPTQRENSGGWVRVGVPRLILLQALNGMGLSQLNHLAVTRFAIDEANRDLLTPSYDLNLTANFRPRDDYQTSIRAVTQPLMVLAGDKDEAFHTEHFADVFSVSPGLIGVKLLPGIDHAGLILQPDALQQTVAAVSKLQAPKIQADVKP
ncbi:alpha/beta fold hydrolase [Verminephrobacter eiseniae]|uniref:alpha/beta hydrolase n=1 Tax=Verminephrobacter eiseniae TaxID=364317 RepID=UPI002238D749|nr:alpha/beta fold hydrolase [Verminephrobacter eiseniae]MCW5263034.1 alpha/beta fold hydrolase [Verminephrobacter eiseniae]